MSKVKEVLEEKEESSKLEEILFKDDKEVGVENEIKIYMAGKLFSEADKRQREKEYNQLEEINKFNGINSEIFSPIYAPINDKSTKPTSIDVFSGDEGPLMSSDVIFVDLTDEDVGVAMELGMILYGDVKIYAYISDIRIPTAGDYDGIHVPFGYNQFVVGGIDKYFDRVHLSFEEALDSYVSEFA